MKSAVLTWIAKLAAGAALTMPLVWGQEGQEHHRQIFPRYRVIDLGTLGSSDNDWWNVAFRVRARGLTTSLIPIGERASR